MTLLWRCGGGTATTEVSEAERDRIKSNLRRERRVHKINEGAWKNKDAMEFERSGGDNWCCLGMLERFERKGQRSGRR